MVRARALALRALTAVHRGRAERLRDELDGHGVEGRELAFAWELTHGVLRRERLLDHVLEGFAVRGLPKDPHLRVALRLGVQQLLFVPGMPAHAAVHETVELVRQNRGFANAMLRNVAQAIDLRTADPAAPMTELALGPTRVLRLPKPLPADELSRLAIVHSLPDWLARRVDEQHGREGLTTVAEAASERPGVFLRTGPSVQRATLAAELVAAGVEVEDCEHPRLLRWTGGESPFATAPFRVGRFVVQDPTALAAVEAVPCGPGDTVVDLCAAPGTKTTWLAERVRPGGRVFAYDPDERRRQRIADNVERLRLEDVVEVVDDPSRLPEADCVLADVPCSNTGVLGRRVEVRRRLRPTTFAGLVSQQREVLRQALRSTRPGGATVYATCSIDREENDGVVDAALGDPDAPAATLVSRRLTLPRAGHHDGGYVAVLRRAPAPGVAGSGGAG